MSEYTILDDMLAVSQIVDRKLITREDYREHGEFSERQINKHYGNFRAARRAAGLEESRGEKQILNQTARHSDLDTYRKLKMDCLDWADTYRKTSGKRFQTMLVLSDVHDELCDPFIRRVFMDTVKRVQPEKVIIGGDFYDLAEFGRYNVDPRNFDIVGKLQWGHQFLKEIREASPETEITLVAGNHEARLEKYISDMAPPLKVLLSDLHGFTIPKLLGLDKYEVRYVSRNDLAAVTAQNIQKEITKNTELLYDCFLVSHYASDRNRGYDGMSGHHHALETWTVPHLKRPRIWTQLGCLHKIAAEYCDAQPIWNLGFGTVLVDTHNQIPQMNYHVVGDFATVHGKHYIRHENEV